MGGSLLHLWGTMQGREHGKQKSKPNMGLQSLGQGSQIKARNGENWAGLRCGVQKTETKVCGGVGYTVEDFRMSLGHGDVWIGVPVWCYTECNTPPELRTYLVWSWCTTHATLKKHLWN